MSKTTNPKGTLSTSSYTSTYILGRTSYNFSSHNPENFKKNLDYSSVINTISSNVFAKPLNNMSNDIRIQRLRLSTIGISSMALKNNTDPNMQIRGKNQDVNLVNNVLARVRGAGYVGPKKGK